MNKHETTQRESVGWFFWANKSIAKKELGSEIADVILTAAILAKRLNIDIVDSVENKINVVRARKYE